MLDMGFQPQVDAIVRRLPRKRQTMFFSATLDGGRRACAFVHAEPAAASMPSCRRSSSGDQRHRFVGVTAEGKVDMLVKMLNHDDGLTLVFVRTKRGADRRAAAPPSRRECRSDAWRHGPGSPRARPRAVESGKVATLVATDVRGAWPRPRRHLPRDQLDPPADNNGYTHRVGRTAQAGRDGTGITLVLPEQQAEVSHVARSLGEQDQFEQQGMYVAPKRLVYSGRRGRSSGARTAPAQDLAREEERDRWYWQAAAAITKA